MNNYGGSVSFNSNGNSGKLNFRNMAMKYLENK